MSRLGALRRMFWAVRHVGCVAALSVLGTLTPNSLPYDVDRRVSSDRQDQSPDRTSRRVELGDVGPEFQKYVLNNVVCRLPVTEDPIGDSIRVVTMRSICSREHGRTRGDRGGGSQPFGVDAFVSQVGTEPVSSAVVVIPTSSLNRRGRRHRWTVDCRCGHQGMTENHGSDPTHECA